jgi:hypothetical protein
MVACARDGGPGRSPAAPAEIHTVPRLSFLLVPSLALALAACGGSKSSTSAGLTGTATKTVTVTTPTTAPTTSSRTSTTPAGVPICRAATLALSYLGSQGAAGHGLLGFALKNTGSTSCNTIGYPGIQFLDKAGKPLPTTPSHTTQDYFGTAPKVLLTVAPGATASFRLGVTHVPTPTQTCTTASALQVIPPNDTSTLKITIPDGAYECGTATVSPMRPGTSAYPSA